MNRGTSLYLDLVRFGAALVVFLGHLSSPAFTGGFLAPLAAWLSAAVMVFFVLSGFVIAHVTDDRAVSAGDYAVARLARIYSVALPALLATALLDAVGRAIDPVHYLLDPGYQPRNLLLQFSAAALFLNQLWYLDMPVGTMAPYWSLGYEVWYYVAFGLVFFLRGTARWVALGAVILLVGPIVASYGLFWAAGVVAYRLGKRPMHEAAGLLLCLGGAALLVGATLYGVPGEARVQAAMAPVLGAAAWYHDAVVSLGFAAHLVGLCAIGHRIAPVLGAVERPLRWLAGSTFTLYLLHLPIAHVVRVLLPVPHDGPAGRIILLGGTFLLCLAAASVTERRKRPWQAFFAALLAPRRLAVATLPR